MYLYNEKALFCVPDNFPKFCCMTCCYKIVRRNRSGPCERQDDNVEEHVSLGHVYELGGGGGGGGVVVVDPSAAPAVGPPLRFGSSASIRSFALTIFDWR